MNKKTEYTPYQYSIIRYLHDPTTHEFLNIGLALYSPAFNYFKVDITSRYARITDTFFDADGSAYSSHVNKLMRRFSNLSEEISNNQIDMFNQEDGDFETYIRKFLRKESSFRYSGPASGIAPASEEGLKDTFNRLFSKYILKYIRTDEDDTRDEDEVWNQVYKPKIEEIDKGIIYHLNPRTIETPKDNFDYKYSWRNGAVNIIEPLSFDMKRAGSIRNKAHRYYGIHGLLNQSNVEISQLYLLLGKPRKQEVIDEYNKAINIISPNGDPYKYKLEIIEEDGAKDFASHLKSEISKISQK